MLRLRLSEICKNDDGLVGGWAGPLPDQPLTSLYNLPPQLTHLLILRGNHCATHPTYQVPCLIILLSRFSVSIVSKISKICHSSFISGACRSNSNPQSLVFAVGVESSSCL